MPEPLFIGIDGGGTNCRARICDASGRVIGSGAGGPANLLLGPAVVMRSILAATRAAASAGGLAEAELARARAGFALAGTELVEACQQLLAEPHPFASVTIESDAYGALLGAHGGGDGAVLILGTGSAGLAVVGGKRFRVSGYGYLISDEASGFWIGSQAIRRALWGHDGRAAVTPLSEALLAHFEHSSDAIVAFAKHAAPHDFAKWAPVVLDHAAKGDPLALAIVNEAAADAAKMIEKLLDVAPVLSLVGGLAEPLATWLTPEVRKRISPPEGDALDGAVVMAKRAYQAASPAVAAFA
jgi:glucosamine kinase